MEKYTIKDLESLSGIKAHTLRIWEQRYSIIAPSRTDTNIRYYNATQLKKILNVSLLNKYGYKISHIDKMNEDEMHRKIISLSLPAAQQESIINTLIQCMIDMKIVEFESILTNCIATKGVEKTIIQIVYPYLEKTGMLWLTNHVNPAQEHLISNIIRQKLILGIEQSSPILKKSKSVLLFLPEGEYHELSLLFIHYMLKQRGASIIYLGCSIPLSDVVYTAKLLKPDYLYTHLTNANGRIKINTLIDTLNKSLPTTPLVISGRLTEQCNKKPSAKLLLQKSLQDVLTFANQI